MEDLELLFFTQRNCPPCGALKPTILRLQETHKFRVRLVEASAETRDLFMANNVRSAPTVICINETSGKEVGRFTNALPADIVEQYLKNWGLIPK